MISSNSAIKFSHPREYRIVGVAGSGAFAVVCKAEVLDETLARSLGLLAEQSMSRQATTMSGQYSSDIVQDAPSTTHLTAIPSDAAAAVSMPHQPSPLQQLQRQASAALAECPPSTSPGGFMTSGSMNLLGGGGSSGSVLGGCTTSSSSNAARHHSSPGSAGVDGEDTVRNASRSGSAGGSRPRRGSTPPVALGDAGRSGSEPPSHGHAAIKQLIDVGSLARAVDPAWRLHYLRKVCREVEIIRHFNAVPQVINLGDMYLSADECDLYIVMPYVEHNLRQIVEVYPLEEPLVRWIACQMLLGLHALHRCGVVHRDLTLNNVLVDGESWDVRIADFGLSRARESADKDISLDVVTLPYRAPELLLDFARYDQSIDIWAFGCIVAEAFLRAPFLFVDPAKSNPDAFKQLKQVLKFTGFPDVERVASMASVTSANFLRNWQAQLGDKAPRGQDIGDVLRLRRPDSVVSEEALEVMRESLQFEPSSRLTAEQLLNKPWFQNDPDCKGLIDICFAMTPPEPCPTDVEQMNFDQLRGFLRGMSDGRRANIDSYVSEQQQQ